MVVFDRLWSGRAVTEHKYVFLFFVCVYMYVSNHFNHCIKLFAPCGPLIGNKQFLYCPGADPGFQVSGGGGGGANFKKLRRAEGGAKNVGVFRVKNHYFMQKNLIFSNFRGGGGGAECAPTGSAPVVYINDNR